MTEQLTPGQSLTPEQVRDLPDGAAIEAVLLDGIRYNVEVNSSIRRLAEGFLTTAQWKDCILVSLPPAPSEPSPGEGYRWVEELEPLCANDQRESYQGAGDWFDVELHGVICWDTHCYRRRIEPQAEPTPRASSEIEREAARALVAKRDDALRMIMSSPLGDPFVEDCRDYVSAYDYARSIGAIE